MGFETNKFSKFFYADGRIFGFNAHSYLEHTLETRKTTHDYIVSPNYHPIRFVKIAFPLVAFGLYNVVLIWHLSSKIELFFKRFGDYTRIEALSFDHKALTVQLDDGTIHVYTQLDIMLTPQVQGRFETETPLRLTTRRVTRMTTGMITSCMQCVGSAVTDLYRWAVPSDLKIYKTIM